MRDIQISLGFANFYWRFIQGFSQVAAPLTLILKISSTILAKLKKDVVEIDGGSRARCNRSELDRSKIDSGKVDDKEVGDDEIRKNFQKSSKSQKTVGSNFFTSRTRLVFTKLRQVFVKALIIYYFDLKRHIQIETDISSYAMGEVLS